MLKLSLSQRALPWLRFIGQVLADRGNVASQNALHATAQKAERAGNHQLALKTYQYLVEREPHDARALCGYVAAARAVSKSGQAKCLLNAFLDKQAPSAIIYTALADLHVDEYEFLQAQALYKKACVLDAACVAARLGLGRCLHGQGLLLDAARCFEEALVLDPFSAELHWRYAVTCQQLQRSGDALRSLLRAVKLDPESAEIQRALGAFYLTESNLDLAIDSFDQALNINPNDPIAFNGKGVALQRRGKWLAALKCYEKAARLDNKDAIPLRNQGGALMDLELYSKAIPYFRQSLALDNGLPDVPGLLLHCQSQVCDWTNLDEGKGRLMAAIQSGQRACPPFCALGLITDVALLRVVAATWAASFPTESATLPMAPLTGRRLRVAYVSSDFCSHAVSLLMAEVFETHDRSVIELYAVSLRSSPDDPLQIRVRAAFEHWVDADMLSDSEVIEKMRGYQIDIAIDLNGFSAGARPTLFSKRLAPIQVSYLGFLGSSGASFMDYLVADSVLVPPRLRKEYAERLLYLPSYQLNDTKRSVSKVRLSREEFGLAEGAFVFGCFNNSYKLTPEIFSAWMTILGRVPESMLFLYAGSLEAVENLRREAMRCGIAPERLIFASRVAQDIYLSRLKLIDLYLDTQPYSAGTAASDALRVGVPVLTCLGETFAARMAASVLTAVGLTDLIVADVDAYISHAVMLATNPDCLNSLRSRLDNIASSELFNVKRHTLHLERGYQMIAVAYQAGDLADVHVPPISPTLQ